MNLSMTNARDVEPSDRKYSDSSKSSRSFGFSLPFMRSKAQNDLLKNKKTISQIKLQIELCFQDVDGPAAERLRYKIRGTREVKDLWMLRSDVYQLISHQIGQTEAAKRINALLPCFEHWMPEKSLVKI